MKTFAIIITLGLLGGFLYFTNQYEINQKLAYLKVEGCARFNAPLPENFGSRKVLIYPNQFDNKLELTKQKITHLPTHYFKNIDCINTLDLSENSFGKLPSAITELEGLKELNMDGNQIKKISSDFFNQNPFLEKVILSRNGMKKLPLTNFIDLKLYDLSNNQIEEFGAYKSVNETLNINIEEIYLKNNNLTYIPSELSYVNRLNTLTLSLNKINTLQSFNETTFFNDLKTLNLNNNELIILPDALGAFPQLENLYLNDNKITGRLFLMGYYRLKHLDINNQLIKAITLGGTYNLEILNAKANRINEITILNTFPNLKEIILTENEFLSLPDFTNATQLRSLDLAINQIIDIDWEDIGHIEKVSLRNNIIRNIARASRSRKYQIKELDLSSNYIQELNLDDLPTSLEYLNLNSNEIKKLKARKKHPNLTHLKLAYNGLADISISFLKKIPLLQSLELDGTFDENPEELKRLEKYCFENSIELILN